MLDLELNCSQDKSIETTEPVSSFSILANTNSINLNFKNNHVYNFLSEGEVTDILVGPFLPKPTFQQLAVSTSSGKVLILVDGKVKALLNPKSGPLLSLAAGSLTRFSSVDLAVGDNLGQITIYSGTQVVAKASALNSVQSLAFTKDIVGNVQIIAGSSLGNLSCHHFHTRMWRTSLSFNPTLELLSNQSAPSNTPITDIKTIYVQDSFTGAIAAYTFVINNTKHLHIYSSSQLVAVVSFPNPIVSICKGNFLIDVTKKKLEFSSFDILCASQTGETYYLNNLFKPVFYTKFSHSVSQILPYRPKNLPLYSPSVLIVRDRSNKVYFYHNQSQIHSLVLTDWITKVITGDLLNTSNFSQRPSSSDIQQSQTHLKKCPFLEEIFSLNQLSEENLGPDIIFALDNSTVIVFSGSVGEN